MNFWDLPRDTLALILHAPQSARAMSYACSGARDALRGLFTYAADYSRDDASYVVAGADYQKTLIFIDDSIVLGKTNVPTWYVHEMNAMPLIVEHDHGRHLRIPRLVNENHIIVADNDELAFISKREWADDFREIIGVPGAEVVAIYEIRAVYMNFTGIDIDRRRGGNDPFILGGCGWIMTGDAAEFTQIRGTVVGLRQLYGLDSFYWKK